MQLLLHINEHDVLQLWYVFKCSSLYVFKLIQFGWYLHQFLKHNILMIDCFMFSENRFKNRNILFKISMYMTLLKKCGFLQTAKIFTFLHFSILSQLIYCCFFINTNNQGFIHQGSSCFLKPICERYIYHLHMPQQ